MTRLRSVLLALVATVAVSVAAARLQGGGGGSTPVPTGTGTVARVVDGDTIAVRVGTRQEKVRLVGIDTPESVKPRTPVQCFAHEASERTRALVPPGTRVRLVRDVEARDRYGRLLAYVYRDHDGLFVNLTLAQEGYAAPLTIPPNVAHADELVAAARSAREAGRGLWGRCGGPHEAPP
ncbi:MAG TPA: thermonuclease family protein [Acidimicrobiales bacterium]|nr:thermonuclease family protein [Acidimicrobiales bacterium]